MFERSIGAAMAVLQKALGITLIAAVLLNFANVVGRYGFAPFSAWRILVGVVGLLAIWLA